MRLQVHEIHYRLNERDEIVFVNDAWDAFAEKNAGAHLSANQVLGRPLWEFISDPTTELLYRDILARVRDGRGVRFVFRCDSPDRRRRLEIEVSSGAGRWTDFRVRTLLEEARPSQPLLDPASPRSAELLRVCGWCKKFDVGGRWVEVEEAVTILELFDQALLPDVTHGICEECYSAMVATLGKTEEEATGEPRGGQRQLQSSFIVTATATSENPR